MSDIASIAQGVRDRAVDPLQPATEAVSRLHDHNEGPNGLNAFLAALSIEEVAALEGVANGGRLSGVPVAGKDNMATVGFPTTCGSKILEGYRAPYHVLDLAQPGLAVLRGDAEPGARAAMLAAAMQQRSGEQHGRPGAHGHLDMPVLVGLRALRGSPAVGAGDDLGRAIVLGEVVERPDCADPHHRSGALDPHVVVVGVPALGRLARVHLDGEAGRESVVRRQQLVDHREHVGMLDDACHGWGLGEQCVDTLRPKALEVVAAHQLAA